MSEEFKPYNPNKVTMRHRSEIKEDLRKCHQDMVTAEMSLDIRDLLMEIRDELKELNNKIQSNR
jgi:hypothetical protein